MTVRHYITERYTAKDVFLEDGEYGRALDCLVKGVCDILLVRGEGNDERIFLGQRRVHPQPDWWLIGGRMKCGETASQAAARAVFRETGLQPKAEDLTFINVYTFSFGLRQQAPQENGTCDVSIVQAYRVTGDVEPKLDSGEYRSGMWYAASEVMNCERFHPAIRHIIADYHLARAQTKLYKTLVDSRDAKEIVLSAQAMRPWLAERDAVTEVAFHEESYVYRSGSGSVKKLSDASYPVVDFKILTAAFFIGTFTGWMMRR